MAIPKVIHYCWFGGNPLPDKVRKCIESWKKFCPDYRIICWNESNYDVNKIRYTKEAYNEKKWAFVSDYARLDIIYENGGIYLDTDVELICSLDILLHNNVFLAIDKERILVNTGLGFGAVPKSELINDLKQVYERISFYKVDGSINTKACTYYVTEKLGSYGYKRMDVIQEVAGACILPSSYFCPIDYNDGSLIITAETIGIHWYDMSWFSDEDRYLHHMEIKLKRRFPAYFAIPIAKIYRNGYRLVEYSKKGILLDKIRKKLIKSYQNIMRGSGR